MMSRRSEAELRKQRQREAIHLQEMEGNPFTDEDHRMFEMFDREGWPDERRRAYILEQIRTGMDRYGDNEQATTPEKIPEQKR